MTERNCAELQRLFGGLPGIPDKESFLASVNRNCFRGAMNFLCTLILHYHPRARIVFISNYEACEKPELLVAQRMVAESWHFPLIEVWRKLGFSGHLIPGTAQLRAQDDLSHDDLPVQRIYCPDGTHPHSDTTCMAQRLYAQVIAKELEGCV